MRFCSKQEEKQGNGKAFAWREWGNTDGQQRESRSAEHQLASVFSHKKNSTLASPSRIKEEGKELLSNTGNIYLL